MRQYTITTSFTRPNDAITYTLGDLVANDIIAANVVPMTFTIPSGFLLTGVRIQTTNTVNTNAQFYLHLFQKLPASTSGDNAVFAGAVTDTNYFGFVFVDCTKVALKTVTGQGYNDPNILNLFTDTNQTINGPVSNVYGFLEARAAYTPSAQEVYTVTLIGVD